MVDNKPINDQIHEFQEHLRHVQAKGTFFSSEHKIGCLIDKLPPSWSNVAKDLLYLQGTITYTQALKRLRIEEEYRLKSKARSNATARVNLVESHGKPKAKNHLKTKKNSFKRKHNFQPNHQNPHYQNPHHQNLQHHQP